VRRSGVYSRKWFYFSDIFERVILQSGEESGE
jgi:hypothetical protein